MKIRFRELSFPLKCAVIGGMAAMIYLLFLVLVIILGIILIWFQ